MLNIYIDFVYLIKVLILLNLIKQKKTKKSPHYCSDFRIYNCKSFIPSPKTPQK